MNLHSSQRLLAGFALALGLLGAVAWFNWRHAGNMAATAELVAHTHSVQTELNRLMSLLQDIETGARGFVITGDPAFLEPYEAARSRVIPQFQVVRSLTRDNPRQQASCAALEPLLADRVSQSQDNVELRKTADFEAVRQKIVAGAGKVTMDQIRMLVARMDKEEGTLLAARTIVAQREADRTTTMTVLGSLVSFTLLTAVFAVVLRENWLRQRAQAELDRFFTLSLDMLCIAGSDGYFKRVSHAFTSALGWSVEEMQTRPILEFVHPADRDATLREVERQVVSGEKVLQFENRYRHKDGSYRRLSWKSAPQPGGLMYAVARDVTEKYAAEQAMRESETRYRTLFESIDEGFCIIEMIFDAQDKPVDYRFLVINPSFEKQTGMKDALGKRMRELAPQHESHWFETYGRIAATGESARFQNRAEQLDRWFDVYAFRFGEPRNRQVAILFSDITQRKKTEAALQASEENLDVTLQSIGDGVLVTDARGQVTRLNAVAEQLTGWRQKDAAGRRVEEVFQIINEATRQPAVIPVKAVLTTGEIHGLANHTILIGRDGKEWPIADSAAPIRDREGRILGVVLVFRDVTQEKAAEVALRRVNDELEQRVRDRTAELVAAENKFRTLVEQSLVGIYLIQAGHFVYVNPRMTDMLGYTPEELAARPVADFVLEADRALAAEKIRQRLAGDSRHTRYQMRLLHKSGAVVIVEPHGARSEYQGAPAVIGSLMDVTERERAAAEIRLLNATLEQRVEERTSQLEAANKELEAFSYSVSHDLRAPLRHVQGYVDMLNRALNGQLSEKALRYMRTIKDASVQMGQLIDDLLEFSRMGRVELCESTNPLDRVVQETIQSLAMATQGRNIVWKIAPLPAVMSDPSMLRQVLINLIGNAVKYTRDRNPAEIEIGCAGEENGRVILFVKDNGAGFDMQYVDKLFGVFQRLHRPEEFEGTGIGLATVRRVVARHGGRAWAEGKLGVGATIYITLKPAARTMQPSP